MRTKTKTFFRLDIFSTFRSVHTLIFTYVSYIVIGLHEKPENFYREKRSVALVTGHLLTFLVVLSLFGDYANISNDTEQNYIIIKRKLKTVSYVTLQGAR